MKKILLSLPLFVLGCAGEMPSALQGKELAAQDAKLSLAEKNKETYKSLLDLKTQNDAMCLMVQKQRVECPFASSLVPGESEKVLGCVSGVAADSIVGVNYEMSVTPPPGTKVYLSTKGGAWRTNEVGAGFNQKLTWGPKKPDSCNPTLRVNPASAQSQLRAPRLLELSELDVVVVPDDKSRCYDQKNWVPEFGAFEVTLNRAPLFKLQDLYGDSSGRVQVGLSSLDTFLSDPKCIVPQQTLETALSEAKAKSPSTATSTAAVAANVDEEYARETGRNQSLRLALTGQEKLGCWAFDKIRKLEVKIEGASAPNASRGDSSDQLKNEGNAKSYSFNFGRGITHSISEENGVFKPGGGFVSGEFELNEIQELNFLRITKNGTSYDNQEFTTRRSCGFLGLGSCTSRKYHRYETNRRSLSAIKILVNDQVVFEKSGISFVFERGKLEWPGNNKVERIQDNPKFRELMRRTDCPAG
jgi:hypothetical protein